MAEDILARHGKAAQAILFYGSCLRTGNDREGIVDLYLLVDGYKGAYRSRLRALLNQVLPPNVFYLEIPFQGRMVRAKYAVFSLRDLLRGTSNRWFHSYLWGRLAQPAALIYSRNQEITSRVQSARAQAVVTFITRVLPAVPAQFTARELWRRGFSLSYRAELRAERQDKLIGLFDSAPGHYEAMTSIAMGQVPFCVEILPDTEPIGYRAHIPGGIRFRCRVAWLVRCLQGKGLSVLRLLNGLTTFRGGLDYILWKIERHSGVRVEMDPRLRRIPVIGVCILFWRLYRRGAFR